MGKKISRLKVIVIILLIIIFFILILWFSFGDADSFFRDILSLILPIASRGSSQSLSGTSPSLDSTDGGIVRSLDRFGSFGKSNTGLEKNLDCSKLKLGDVNGDGKISLEDLGTLNTYIAGGKAKCPENGDLNTDGKVNDLDSEIFTNAVLNSGYFSQS